MSRTKILAVLVVLIILVGAVTFYLNKPPVLSVSVATSTSVASAGSPITFTAITSLSSATVTSVVWNFGDGANQTSSGATITHTYADGGRYLVMAQVTATYQNFVFSGSTVGSNNLALLPLSVQPSLTPDQAQEASVPTISFPSASNPTAPVFNVGDVLHPVGGFLEAPANSNWTITQYAWDFGNGNKQTVAASNDTGLPLENVTATYSAPGLYPLSLTLTTVSNGATLDVTTIRTIAVKSSTLSFALLTSSSGVQNPSVITFAEVAAGGPETFDPQIDDEEVGMGVIVNIFQTLVQFNGSSTVSFIPYLAAVLPTQENGGISSDYKTYTFRIRNDQYFSNGDPVTAYDVWFTMARCIAFTAGSPGTSDYVQAQFLIPGVQNGTASMYTNNTWAAANQAVTYDNATDTVTFHFNRPMLPTLTFQALASAYGGAIVDSRYASSVGAGFNEADWSSYESQANSGSYNTAMEWSPVGSGPFMIQSFIPGQSVELVPNPHYVGVPGIPRQNVTAVIDWIKSPDTAMLMFQDGQADLTAGGYDGLPSSDAPAMEQLESQGLANIYNFPTFTVWYYNFNIEIDKDLEATQFGTGFNEPSNYFADLPTRLAWINAYDYAGYLDNILGNAKYGMTFGSAYQGAIPAGMIYAPPTDELGGLPAQNLAAAKGNFSISAWANQKITVPICVYPDDLVDTAAAEEWAGTLAQISNGNINAKIALVSESTMMADSAQGADPMSVIIDDWYPGTGDASDFVSGMYQEGAFEAAASNWLISNFASLPPSTPYDVVHVNGTTYTQDKVWSWMQGNVTLGDSSVDPAVRARTYLIATKLAIAMGLYVYVYQARMIWFFRSWLKGYDMQENPMIGAVDEPLFYWMTKG